MKDSVPLVWTETELEQTPSELLSIAQNLTTTSLQRTDAYRKSEAKIWYERIVLAPTVMLDVNQIAFETGRDVLQLRALVGNQPPWRKALT